MVMALKALFFDVFGTLVDWRSSIAREAEALLKPKGVSLDYFAFADAWRGEYQGALEEVRAGRIGFCKLDILHRRNLDLTLQRFAVDGLGEEEKRNFNLAWHRLDAWPDVPAGLARLKRGYVIAPVSNGNISLMVDLAPQPLPLGRDPRRRDRRRLQTKAARLSRRRGSAQSQAASLHDGGGAFQRSRRRRRAWFAHRACGAAERTWTGPRRSRAHDRGRFFSQERRGSRGQARSLNSALVARGRSDAF
jgi:HAD superfamily hydrolase (TIGR01493 family)